jgi:YHS domain-containing protein
MNMAKDPICGMMVDEERAKFKTDYDGKTFYFCAASCKATFDKAPAKFAGGTAKTGHGCNCGGDHC